MLSHAQVDLGRILRYADQARPEELQALKDELSELDAQTETNHETVTPEEKKPQPLKDRFKEAASRVLDKLATTATLPPIEPEADSYLAIQCLPENYNDGRATLSPTEVQLLTAARQAKRQMWLGAKVADYIGLGDISHEQSMEWLEKFERRTYWLSAKHLLGYDIGNSELAKRIKNADPEALKAQFPEIEERMVRVEQFMQRRGVLPTKRHQEN